MIVSNIFVPLVGLVDTAIVGHLPGTHHLAGVALGSIIITQLIWVCGFLRMSTTGLSAHSHGSGDLKALADVLKNAAIFAALIGVVLILLQQPLFKLGLYFSDATEIVEAVASDYFSMRIHIIPVSLLNLVASGWMLGQQWHRQVMIIQITANLVNVMLSYLFAIVFSMGVIGVAVGTVIAEILVFVLYARLIMKQKPEVVALLSWRVSLLKAKGLLTLNGNMFLRNLILQICIGVITFAGLQQGELTAATNSVLMQFFVLIALGLDGIAYSVEALIGESKGKQDTLKLKVWLSISLIWSNIFSLVYSFIFLIFFSQIAGLITNIVELQNNMLAYKWYIILLPVIAHWCFTFDGIYIGLSRSDIMRNSMLFSAAIAFCPWFFSENINNHFIWSVFLIFLIMRGVSLAGHLFYVLNKKTLLLTEKG